ncbi:MAG: N-acetylneuraminate synthase family protein [Treponema sp.]
MALVIAEIGTAHEGARDKARALVDAAAGAGADAVKFQWVYADEILHPDTGTVSLPTGQIRLYDRFKSLECSADFYAEMLEYAHERKVKFGCSPFGLKSLSELLALKPDFIKIASPELNHYPMLKTLASFRQSQRIKGLDTIPVIVSSGVSRLSDIEKALEILGTDGVTLLHCITSYPAPEDEYNLRLIAAFRGIFGVETGVSDHSLAAVLVPSLCVSQGGAVIEKHITLSRDTSGLDDPIALDGKDFALMCSAVKEACSAIKEFGEERGKEEIIARMSGIYGTEKVRAVLGDGVKRLAPSEKKNYGRTNRSLHFTRALKAGECVSASDIAVLRTEKVLTPGISPEYADCITGARLTRDVTNGEGVQWEDFIHGAEEGEMQDNS